MIDVKRVRPIEILIIEDNPGDVRLTREALKGFKLANSLSVAEDGVEAIKFLRKEGEFKDVPKPDIILLDLNLPKKRGLEVLKEIKHDEELKTIPVVVLTSSSAEQDIKEAYSSYANSYITKPIDFEEFFHAMASIEEFWLSVVSLPS